MSAQHELEVRQVDFVLPVTLAQDARRDALLQTGVEPTAEQIFVVRSLVDLPRDLRERMVDTWEKLNVHVDASQMDTPNGPRAGRVRHARNDGYLWLQRGINDDWTRYLPNSEGDGIDVREVFFGADARTVDALEYLRGTLDAEQSITLEAALAGSPLVSELSEGGSLHAEDVLRAYERALDLAQRLIDFVDLGTRDTSTSWVRSAFHVADEAVFLYPDRRPERPNRLAAVLKKADPDAYTRACELLDRLEGIPDAIVAEKIDRVCFHWWSRNYSGVPDAQKVEDLLKAAVRNALSDLKSAERERQETERYEEERAQWIKEHGSQRLRRAAARGYRHDGIYRDERLQEELPGFVGSLGRKPAVRELVNPSERALDLEAEVLALIDSLGITEDQVRLVYAQPGTEVGWAEGEFVQVERYLGRHTVWQSVSGEITDDDIPF